MAIVNSGLPAVQLGFGICLLALASGLWRLNRLALSVTKFLIGLTTVVGIGGVFNPFFAMDYGAANQGRAPPWLSMLAVAVPLVLVGLLVFWILDRYKDEFGRARPSRKGSAT